MPETLFLALMFLLVVFCLLFCVIVFAAFFLYPGTVAIISIGCAIAEQKKCP